MAAKKTKKANRIVKAVSADITMSQPNGFKEQSIDSRLRQRAMELAIDYMKFYPTSCAVSIAGRFYAFLKGDS